MIYCLAIRNLFFFLEFVQTVDKMWEYKMKIPLSSKEKEDYS